MDIITFAEAQGLVSDMEDGIGKKVDAGIFNAVVYFTQVVTALGIATEQSCEGHFDWGNPYPSITFVVPFVERPMPSLWKFWRYQERRHLMWHNRKHWRNMEAKTEYLLAVFTRVLMKWQEESKVKVENTLCFERTDANRFQLQPVFFLHNQSLKSSGDFAELGRLLIGQRKVFEGVACELAIFFEETMHFVGVPPDGCQGCLGQI
jgi:hypothetical protein